VRKRSITGLYSMAAMMLSGKEAASRDRRQLADYGCPGDQGD
jgi:hypothetical protein